MKSRIEIRGGTIVTLNPRNDIFVGDVVIEDDRIIAIKRRNGRIEGPTNKDQTNKDQTNRDQTNRDQTIKDQAVEIIDASNHFIIPGFIQLHTHLCQVLFRGMADDLPLLVWLEKKIWPLEAQHTAESLSLSALLGLWEMQSLGTTSILDMGTIHHTDAIFSAAETMGMRYWGGKTFMDRQLYSGPLFEPTDIALKSTEALIAKWHKKNELLNYVLCPRFVVSTTERLLREILELSRDKNMLIHLHANENLDEIELVHQLTGKKNISYLNSIGMLGPKTIIAHGVHMDQDEVTQIADSDTRLAHCPSANLKLGNGIAPIETYLNKKIIVGIGSDGAACNNTMDPFFEMRLTALLQKPLFGPQALRAETAFRMATLFGAQALGVDDLLGSVEIGKKADLVTVDRTHPSVATVEDAFSALVYSCSGRDVTNVIINGRVVVRNRRHQLFDTEKLRQRASRTAVQL